MTLKEIGAIHAVAEAIGNTCMGHNGQLDDAHIASLIDALSIIKENTQ